MHSNNKAQSILEYSLMAAIIFIGIIVGGPFLQRAIQGFFKINNDTMQDSASEIIQQDDFPPPPPCTCNYGSSVPTWPKAANCGVGPCSKFQRYHYRTCTPLACEKEYECYPEADCCSTVDPVSCGMLIGGSTDCTSRSATSTYFPAAYTGTCVTSAGVDTHNCAYGERIYQIECGDPAAASGSTISYACKSDTETQQNCLPFCFGAIAFASSPCNPYEADNILSLPDRNNLINEIIFRKSPANNTPYRPFSPDLYTTNIIVKNAYRLNNMYLYPSDCNNALYCERSCPVGFAPNATFSGCDPLTCWYGYWGAVGIIPNGITNPADSTCDQTPGKKQRICPGNIAACGYLLLCSSDWGTSYAWYGASLSVLTFPFGTVCPAGQTTINDPYHLRTFCYLLAPSTTPASPGAAFNCNAGDLSTGTRHNTLYYGVVRCSP